MIASVQELLDAKAGNRPPKEPWANQNSFGSRPYFAEKMLIPTHFGESQTDAGKLGSERSWASEAGRVHIQRKFGCEGVPVCNLELATGFCWIKRILFQLMLASSLELAEIFGLGLFLLSPFADALGPQHVGIFAGLSCLPFGCLIFAPNIFHSRNPSSCRLQGIRDALFSAFYHHAASIIDVVEILRLWHICVSKLF